MMNKFSALSIAVLLSACSTMGETQQQMIETYVKNQCKTQLPQTKTWKIAGTLMGTEQRQQLEEKICDCISQEAPQHLNAEHFPKLLNPTERTQVLAEITTKSMTGCAKRLLNMP